MIYASLLMASILNIGLGIYVLKSNFRKILNVIFFLLCLSIGGWALSIFVILYVSSNNILLGKLPFIFASFIAGFLLSFTFILGRYPEFRKLAKNLIIILAMPILFLFLSLFDFIVTSVGVKNNFIINTYGPLYPAFAIFIFSYVVLSFGIIIYRYKTSVLMEKQKIKFIFLGTACFVIPILFTNLILPSIFNYRKFNTIGPAFTLFLTGFTAYAILRYRFFDIRLMIRQSTVFALILAAIVALFSFSHMFLEKYLPEPLAFIAFPLFIVAAFIPLKTFLERYLNRIFKIDYNYSAAFSELTSLMSSSQKLDEVLDTFLKKIAEFLKIETGAILITLDMDKEHFISKNIFNFGNDLSLRRDSVIVNHFLKCPDVALIVDELECQIKDGNSQKEIHCEIIKEIKELGFVAALPIFYKENINGIVLLGEKINGEAFTTNDIKLLSSVLRGAGSIIENARLYENVLADNEKLLSLDRAKSDFIDVVSHQFRTPLSSIHWFAELLDEKMERGGSYGADDKEFVKNIKLNCMHLTDTLNNIIDVLLIIEKKIDIEKRPILFFMALNEAIAKYTDIIKEKKLTIEMAKNQFGAGDVSADLAKLKKVLEILCLNAILYSNEGGKIEIFCGTDDIEQKKCMKFSICNQGPSISQEDSPYIFEQFFRGENARKMSPNGTGLGLFIAKKFIEAHGGKIWIESKNDKTTATFVLFL